MNSLDDWIGLLQSLGPEILRFLKSLKPSRIFIPLISVISVALAFASVYVKIKSSPKGKHLPRRITQGRKSNSTMQASSTIVGTDPIESESGIAAGEGNSFSISGPDPRTGMLAPDAAVIGEASSPILEFDAWIDGVEAPGEEISANGSRLTFSPISKPWRPGEHKLKMKGTLDSGTVNASSTFHVEWDADFSKPPTTYSYFLSDRSGKRMHCRLDEGEGALVLTPDPNDAIPCASITSENFTERTNYFRIGCHCNLRKLQKSGFELSGPGGVSVVIGDGDKRTVAFKLNGNYLDDSGIPTSRRLSRAYKTRLSTALDVSGDRWFWLTYQDGHVSLSEGSEGQQSVCSLPLDEAHCDASHKGLSITSFDSEIHVLEVELQ